MNVASSQDFAQLKEAFKKDVAANPQLYDFGPSDWYYVAVGWAAGRDLPIDQIRTFAREIQADMSSS